MQITIDIEHTVVAVRAWISGLDPAGKARVAKAAGVSRALLYAAARDERWNPHARTIGALVKVFRHEHPSGCPDAGPVPSRAA